MATIAEATTALADAIRVVDGIRVHTDPSVTVEPPAVVVALPTLSWDAYCIEPTEASFTVHVIVKMQEGAETKLWDLLPKVAAAVDDSGVGVVRTASSALFNQGGGLPSYQITVEVAL